MSSSYPEGSVLPGTAPTLSHNPLCRSPHRTPGDPVAGHDRGSLAAADPAAERLGQEGARIASPREAAREAAFVITMVPDLAQVEEVTLGENGLARNGD